MRSHNAMTSAMMDVWTAGGRASRPCRLMQECGARQQLREMECEWPVLVDGWSQARIRNARDHPESAGQTFVIPRNT